MGLSLERRLSEQVVIGGAVTVTVTDIGRGRVTIRVDAPADVKILRGELCGRPPAKDPGHVPGG